MNTPSHPITDLAGQYLTLTEAAALLHISPAALCRRIKAHGAPPGALKIGARWFIPRGAIPEAARE